MGQSGPGGWIGLDLWRWIGFGGVPEWKEPVELARRSQVVYQDRAKWRGAS